ncbi:HU family DNA-binding protein [Allobaculum mucilyticum]|uniref:HU family DNA-binding protein n=1 Tax=Allobaculum mucilyticum TaxID=2834459 RepID=UPI001E46AF09|nr:HU family DNA-binding protein [Allobaculum mucilyticum]UNT96236.1 HU family DNA-binding protein [Allobaculum mucilyticum]
MPKFVNKDSLTDTLATAFNLKKKDAAEIITLIFDEMSEALVSEGTVEITGFGKFIIFDRKERMGINPVTKERMPIPATKLPKFKPSQTLKNKCNNRDKDEE